MTSANIHKHVTPIGGRLCWRTLSDGKALIGTLRFPEQARIVEGDVYWLCGADALLTLVPPPNDQRHALSEHHRSLGVDGLMWERVWPTPLLMPEHTFPVRFLSAFSDDEQWSVYGVKGEYGPDHAFGPNTHHWSDVQNSGHLQAIAAPLDATGMTMGQILTQSAVWPDKHGEFYTLPGLHSEWREHMYRYHCLLASAARDPDIAGTLRETIDNDPHLRQISIGPIDSDYCAYIAHLQDHGMLRQDAPWSREDRQARKQVAMAFSCSQISAIWHGSHHRA